MKNLILLFIFIMPLFCLSQTNSKVSYQVFTIDGEMYSGTIESYLGKKINFTRKINELNDNSIPIERISEIRGAEMSKNRKNRILRDNPNIIFSFYDEPKSIDFANMENNLPGIYLQKAGKRYLTGSAMAVAGSIVTGIGAYDDSNELVIIGGITALTGAIIYITGHIQLIKAGKALNSEAITLSPSSEGIGLAINF